MTILGETEVLELPLPRKECDRLLSTLLRGNIKPHIWGAGSCKPVYEVLEHWLSPGYMSSVIQAMGKT